MDDVLFVRENTAAAQTRLSNFTSPISADSSSSHLEQQSESLSDKWRPMHGKRIKFNHITKIESVLVRELGDQVENDAIVQRHLSLLKASIEKEHEATELQLQVLQEHNTALEREKTTMERQIYDAEHRAQVQAAEISDLKNDLREQKKLYRQASKVERRTHAANDKATPKKLENLDKALKDSEQRNHALIKARDALATKIDEQAADHITVRALNQNAREHQAALVEKDHHINNLQDRDLEVRAGVSHTW